MSLCTGEAAAAAELAVAVAVPVVLHGSLMPTMLSVVGLIPTGAFVRACVYVLGALPWYCGQNMGRRDANCSGLGHQYITMA